MRAAALLLALAPPAAADPQAAFDAFAAHCYSPRLTAETAAARLGGPGRRVEFHDLRPFAAEAPSPVAGRPATPGTDRRCEVAVDGAHGDLAAAAALRGLAREGIDAEAPLPATHAALRGPGTALLAARALNPRRIAVVHAGTRPGPDGPETFATVERLTPAASREILE